MSWQTITVLVPNELLKEALIGEFSADHIAGVWERPHESGYLEVVLYFEGRERPPLVEARVGRIFERNGQDPPAIACGEEEEVDWTTEWRKGFSAFTIGRRFRVVPGWEQPPAGDSRIALRIDPGMAFGTGTHETTRMVLEMIEELDLSASVLDLGTGSGILSIAAVQLGAHVVLACDIDADAVIVAGENFSRNGVRVPVYVGSVDAIRDNSVGVVLANLTFESIIGTLPDIRRVLEPGGRVIVSGILTGQALALEDAFSREGLKAIRRVECGEWVSFLAGC